MRGEELTPWILRYGYRQGAFPMTMDDGEVQWFQPLRRALFSIDGIHVSKSLQKVLRRSAIERSTGDEEFVVTFDQAFESVMLGCFRPGDNWLSEHFVRAYGECHTQGWAHSCEVWSEGSLVGGVYGLAMGSTFIAESMFHRKTDCSKIALWAMVNRCREVGFTIFDAQIMNPHLASLGAFKIPHRQYMKAFEQSLCDTTPWSTTA